jgi:hypothetical protein
MQNWILHPSQSVGDPSQTPSQILPKINWRNQVFSQYFHPTCTHMVQKPPWKVHNSMQNLILHPSKIVWTPSQVRSWISRRITGWNQVCIQYLHPTSTNMMDEPSLNVHHSMQNLILHPSIAVRNPSQAPSLMSSTITRWNQVSTSIFTELTEICRISDL